MIKYSQGLKALFVDIWKNQRDIYKCKRMQKAPTKTPQPPSTHFLCQLTLLRKLLK